MAIPNGSETHRLFIAITLPDASLDLLTRTQKKLAQLSGGQALRWTRREHLHLTLHFCGDVDAARVPALAGAVEAALSGVAPFSLALKGIGAFPNLNKPNIIWAGMGGEIATLADVQARVAAAAAEFSEKLEDRAFHGHVTIARVKSGAYQAARRFGASLQGARIELNEAPWQARSVELYRSLLSAKGPEYSLLARIGLTGAE